MDIISRFDDKQSSVAAALIDTLTSELVKSKQFSLINTFTQEILKSFNELKLFIKDESISSINIPTPNDNLSRLILVNSEQKSNLKFPKLNFNNSNNTIDSLIDKLNHEESNNSDHQVLLFILCIF
jgi:hypothetical protein